MMSVWGPFGFEAFGSHEKHAPAVGFSDGGDESDKGDIFGFLERVADPHHSQNESHSQSLGPLTSARCPWVLAQLAEEFEAMDMGNLCKQSPLVFERISRAGPLLDTDLLRSRPKAAKDAAVVKGALLRLLSETAVDYDQALSAVSWSLYDVTIKHLEDVGVAPAGFAQPLLFALLNEYLRRTVPLHLGPAERLEVLHEETHQAFGPHLKQTPELEPLFLSFTTQWFLCLMTTAGQTSPEQAAVLWTQFWRHTSGDEGALDFLHITLMRALHKPLVCDLSIWSTSIPSREQWTIEDVSVECNGDIAAYATYLECLKLAVREQPELLQYILTGYILDIQAD